MTPKKISATRRLSFCAGHRVLGHEGKCSQPHGHQYEVEIEAEADELDAVGRVVDFSVIKSAVGSWLDAAFDHGFLVYGKDQEMIAALESVRGSKLAVLDYNPTAENIAAHIMDAATDLLPGLRVVRVTVHETPNCRAEARR